MAVGHALDVEVFVHMHFTAAATPAHPVFRYQQTKHLEYVARHGGHSRIETSRIYAKWRDETLQEVLGEW